MTTPKIKGRNAIWGMEHTDGDTYASGLVVDKNWNITGETDFIFDDNGFTITEIFFDDRDELEVNIICESATALPARGDEINLCGISCLVQSAGLVWNNRKWKMLSVKVTRYVNLVNT